MEDLIRRALEETGAVRILVIASSAEEKIYPYLDAYFYCPELQAI